VIVFYKIKFMYSLMLIVLRCQMFVDKLPADGMIMPKHVVCLYMCNINRTAFHSI